MARRIQLFLPGLAIVISAISTTPVECQTVNSLEGGAWALQFGIQDNLTLGTFQRGSFSIKRHFSSRSAVRLGAQLGFRSAEVFDERFRTESDNVHFTLDALYQRYLNPESRVNAYFGAGPIGDYLHSTDNTQSTSFARETTRTSWGLGLEGFFGVEYFVARTISLHSEYSAIFIYDWFTTKTVVVENGAVVDSSERSDKEWIFGDGGTVLFGLSAYF